ncbi:MAG: TRAP transporter small permease [Xanthobacteraceae bacterium]|nr:TRAP transporter small permease [Xanthobacteraceae bacterium]
MLEALNAWIVRVLLAAAAVIIFLLGFLVCADVIGRAFFNSPVKGTPEMVSMSIVIICFLLAGYSVQSGSMIYTDVFASMFGVRGRACALLLSSVLGILFFGLIVWGSYEPTLHAWTSGEYEGEGALRVPALPARIIVLTGAVLVVISYVLHAVRAVGVLVTGRAEDEVPSVPTQI